MSKTADNLVYEVAAILGKAVAGEALGQPEYDTIDNNIDPVLAEIENIVYVGDRDDIPDRYFQTIARLVAVHSAAKFSNATVDLVEVTKHENRLRDLAASQPTYQTQKAVYY
ncbi:MAG: hypothetical protein QG616_1556 [Pseudomonadota bacterium]|jgi:hypothetical protein|nr:hypothetical protein [Accumulibacter sp.]MDQ5881725.1 hypothetical protein [Pseudomonadota bacterium]MDQ5915770.1 hypothetical protein [Pseudomonadota bacterium]